MQNVTHNIIDIAVHHYINITTIYREINRHIYIINKRSRKDMKTKTKL